MKKNILLLLLTAGLIAFNSGCTSKESTGDEQPVENADVEKIETIDGADASAKAPDAAAPAAGETKTETKADDAALEASLNDPTPAPADGAATPAATTPAAGDATAVNTPTVDDKSMATTDAPPVSDAQLAPDPALATGADTSTGAPVVSDAGAGAPSMGETKIKPSAVSKAPSAPMKKISAVAPYQSKSGGWVNTVYIARPKEKLLDISMKIFGSDKTKDVKAISENSYLKWRAPKAGDKIYYVSPNRPDDSQKTITYYEDMGMVPETYVAKKGDSLRKVSKELLGYDNAWKEVWASNGIESKTTLKDGETIRYWKMAGGDAMAAAPMSPPSPPPAGATVTDSAPAVTATTAPPAPTGTLPPPPTDASASLPPPPSPGTAATVGTPPPPPADTAAPPPPPPPADTAAAPPPPPPPADDAAAAPPADAAGGKKAKGKDKLDKGAEEEEAGGLNSDALMSMGALGVLVALLAFVIIRKKKQKSQMSNLEMNA